MMTPTTWKHEKSILKAKIRQLKAENRYYRRQNDVKKAYKQRIRELEKEIDALEQEISILKTVNERFDKYVTETEVCHEQLLHKAKKESQQIQKFVMESGELVPGIGELKKAKVLMKNIREMKRRNRRKTQFVKKEKLHDEKRK